MGKESRGAGVAEPPVEAEGGGVRAKETGRNGAGGAKVEEREEHGPPRSVAREYFESLVVTAIMALFGMTFVVQAVKVPTGSMQNTIEIGDHLLVNKFIFAPGPVLPFLPQREIRRGDIIVFKYPGKYQGEERFRDNPDVNDTAENNIPYRTNYVKRVIGLPGDVVEVRDSKVFVNGQPLEEHVITARNGDDNPDTLEREDNAPLTIINSPPRNEGETYDVYLDPSRHTSTRHADGKFIIPEDCYFAMGDNRSEEHTSELQSH